MGIFSLNRDESKYRLSEEAGNAAVVELLAYYEIEIDELPDQDQRDAMTAVAKKLARFYRMGLLENNDAEGTLKVIQHLQAPPGETKDLTYDRMTGAHKLAMDGFKDNQHFARMQALMGSLCGLPAAAMKKLTGNDASAMECLSAVFRQG